MCPVECVECVFSEYALSVIFQNVFSQNMRPLSCCKMCFLRISAPQNVFSQNMHAPSYSRMSFLRICTLCHVLKCVCSEYVLRRMCLHAYTRIHMCALSRTHTHTHTRTHTHKQSNASSYRPPTRRAGLFHPVIGLCPSQNRPLSFLEQAFILPRIGHFRAHSIVREHILQSENTFYGQRTHSIVFLPRIGHFPSTLGIIKICSLVSSVLYDACIECVLLLQNVFSYYCIV